MLKGREIALANTYRDRAIQIIEDVLPKADERIYQISSEKDTLLKKSTQHKRRILYIDLFRKENSNLFWLKAFHKFGRLDQ